MPNPEAWLRAKNTQHWPINWDAIEPASKKRVWLSMLPMGLQPTRVALLFFVERKNAKAWLWRNYFYHIGFNGANRERCATPVRAISVQPKRAH